MSNETYLTQYHYVYRITNVILKKHYYGSRTSRIIPQLDLGVKYLSSSRDTQFKQDQKENPQNYRYKVVSIHTSRVSAIEKEIRLHQKFDVGINPNFYNRSKQTSTKYDVTGMRCVIDNSTKEMKFVAKNHSKILSGEYVGLTQGFITTREVATGKTLSVPKDDPSFKTGELVGVVKGMLTVRGVLGETKQISLQDYRFSSGEFRHICFGKVTAKVVGLEKFLQVSVDDHRLKTGELVHNLNNRITACVSGTYETISVCVDDHRLKTGELVPFSKNKVSAIDVSTGKTFQTTTDDPRFLSGEIAGATKGKVLVKCANGDKFLVDNNDPRYVSGELVGILKGFTIAREVVTGKTLSVPKDDPRFKTGELVGVTNGCKRVYDSIDMIKMTCMLPSDPRYMKSHFPKSYWVEQLNSERNHRIF